jgi:hypothetical protein
VYLNITLKLVQIKSSQYSLLAEVLYQLESDVKIHDVVSNFLGKGV